MTKKWSFLFLAFICLGLMTSCGDDETATSSGTSSSTSYSYVGAVTPASSKANIFGIKASTKSDFNYGWSITVTSAGTFSLAGGTDMEISGTYTTLDSGLLKLTVTSSSGTDAPSEGEEGYALHIPGFVLMLSPVGGEGDLVPMLYSGTCPTENFNINYMMASRGASGNMSECAESASDSNDFGTNVIGVGAFDVSSGSFTQTSRYDVCNNDVSCSNIAIEANCNGACEWDSDTSSCELMPLTYSCSNGLAAIASGSDIMAMMYLTENGGAIVATNPDTTDGTTVIGFPGDEISDASNLNGEYVGITYLPGGTSQETTFPINVTIATESSTTTMTIIKVNPDTGEDTGEIENAVITISNVDSNATGFFRGSLAFDGEVRSYINCSVDLDVVSTGKNLINCLVQKPCSSEITGPAGTACSSGETQENGNFIIVTK